jgi:hypothetical protein
MAVTPPIFDYPTFRYYLELDVLQETAKFLNWVDLNSDAPSGSRDTLVVGSVEDDTNLFVFDTPATFQLKGGTKLYYNDGANFITLVHGVVPDDTEVRILETVVGDVEIEYTVSETGLEYRNAQPIYDSITDEVILQMGYTHPEQVPSAKIPQMMALGRVEAWRKVVQNTVTDTDVVVDELLYLRGAFHQNAIKRWETAQNEYNTTYAPIILGDAVFTQPTTRTYSGAVTARW